MLIYSLKFENASILPLAYLPINGSTEIAGVTNIIVNLS